MALARYGFIVKGPDLELIKHHGRIKTELFDMAVSGVQNVEEAMLVAQELLTKRVQLIELCGAFSAEEADRIREAVNDQVPVGRVQYSEAERERLQREFG
ncbi:DUF6506 family protein [Marinobacterium aestuariivivens]|uniref:DUF6506 family protein n=1 Tax=Marinobacterium aestuariivivens TaxID=1698799 RepID=A0ABW2A0S9_9GAMM